MLAVMMLLLQDNSDTGAAVVGGLMLTILLIFGIIVGVGVYFVPSIIAFARHKTNAVAILALNFFLGWSLVGWVIAMVWALANESTSQQVVVYNQPGSAPPPTAQPQPTPVIQNPSTQVATCPGCGAAVNESASYCGSCGRQLRVQT